MTEKKIGREREYLREKEWETFLMGAAGFFWGGGADGEMV